MRGLLILCILLTACRSTDLAERRPLPRVPVTSQPARNLTASCPAAFSPTFDYFPDKVRVEYANQFSISYYGHYKRVVFKPNVTSESAETYLLVQCGTPVPEHDASMRVITVPAQRFVLGNLALISAANRMGLIDSLIGISSINGVSQPEVIERHKQGLVKEVGAGIHSSVEMAIATDADLLFTFYSAWPNFWRSGQRMNLTLGRDVDGVGTANRDRPALLSRSLQDLYAKGRFDRAQYLIPQAQAAVILGVPADVTNPASSLERNPLRSPVVQTYDLSLLKRFTVRERFSATFEANAFNLFNRTNFAGPSGSVASPLFGVATRTITPSRQLQLGLKLSF